MKLASSCCSALLLASAFAANAKSGMPVGPEADWAQPDAVALASGTLDLTVDTTFDGGSEFIDNPTDGGTNDRGVAIVEDGSGGYWLIGSSSADDGTHVVPAVTPLSANGSAGPTVSYPSSTTLAGLSSIVGAVEGVNNGTRRIYVLGTYHFPGFDDDDFGVLCLDPAIAFGGCAGFGNAGFASAHFDRGGTNDDTPRAIAYDALSGVLYLTGSVDIGGTAAVGVVRLIASSGALDTQWGNSATDDGHFLYTIPWAAGGGAIPSAIVAGAPMLFEHDVFVVGTAFANASNTDTDGFVLPIDGVSGEGFDPLWNSGFMQRVYFDRGTTNKIDTLTATSLRANGSLLIAGQSESDTDVHLILGEYDPVGAPRTDFCGGAGVCQGPLYNQPIPTAVLERPGIGDIVIGASNVDASGHDIQGVYQIDAHGRTVTAYAETTWPSHTGTTPFSYATGLLVDSHDNVLQAGYRLWDSSISDDDMTVARFRADDTIFGSSFGGTFAD